MSVRRSSKPALYAGLLLAAVQGVNSAPRDEGPDETRRLDSLRSELAAAQQAQDPSRLQAAYAELVSVQPNNPAFHRGHGLASYLGGQHQQAIAALQKAAELQSDLAGVRLYLGMSLYRTNRFEEALQALDGSPELVAGEPVALYWKGASHRALGQLASAIAALEAARRGTDSDANLLQLLTRSYSERSAKLLRELLSIAPDSAAARLLKAEELAMDGVEPAALRELDKALASSPDLIGLHLAKGQILWGRGEYDAGAAEFRMELANDPLGVEASLRLAAYALDRGNPAEALNLLRRAERYSPSDERVADLMADAERIGAATGQAVDDFGHAPPTVTSLEDARDAYRNAWPRLAAALLESLVEDRPDFVEARKLLARCLLAEGIDSKAAAQLNAVLELEPGDSEALYLAGKAYERLAAETAEDLFALNPDSASVRQLRGEAFERGPKSDFEKALAEFRAAAELQPDGPGAHHAIARILFKMKRFEEAVPHIQKVLARNRRHGMANYLLGKIHLVSRNRITAIKHLQMAVDARPELAEAKRDLARALVLAGRYEEGIGLYKKLLAVNASDPSLHALLAVAYRTAGRMEEARMHADRARSLGSSKHQPDAQ